MKIAVLFDNLGPYHRARLLRASQGAEVLAVEFSAASAEYAWEAGGKLPFAHACVTPEGNAGCIERSEFQRRLWGILDEFQPAVVAIPGWSTRGAFLSALWARQRCVPAVVMSDSTAWDEVRKPWLEAVKRSYLRNMAAGFVAGTPHRDYLEQLGFPPERVVLGYDVVDNDYFAAAAESARANAEAVRAELALPDRYFLASARFVAKKNFPVLLEGYAEFRAGCGPAAQRDLVLLGDGELRGQIEEIIARLGLAGCVHLPGFRQYDQLPRYYALADAFVHASTTEQWGLVVNEAMAAGLPVIISDRCGCARDLVDPGVNGWTFDPSQPRDLAERLLQFAAQPDEARTRMGAASAAIISAWSTERFAAGLADAAAMATGHGAARAGWFDQTILRLLARR